MTRILFVIALGFLIGAARILQRNLFAFFLVGVMGGDAPYLTMNERYAIMFGIVVGPWIALIIFAALCFWMFKRRKPEIAILFAFIPFSSILFLAFKFGWKTLW